MHYPAPGCTKTYDRQYTNRRLGLKSQPRVFDRGYLWCVLASTSLSARGTTRKEEANKRKKQLQNHQLQVLAKNPSMTASLVTVKAFLDVQAQTAIARWQVATHGDHELHLKFLRKASSEGS